MTKQVKTVAERQVGNYDAMVNALLTDGWTLRDMTVSGEYGYFVAFLEKDTGTTV